MTARGTIISKSFDGVESALRQLKERECGLFVATNKRSSATEAILGRLDIGQYLDGFISSDWQGRRLNKREMVKALLDGQDLVVKECVLVWHTQGDLEAARSCGMDFIFASYGYGHIDIRPEQATKVITISNFYQVLRV